MHIPSTAGGDHHLKLSTLNQQISSHTAKLQEQNAKIAFASDMIHNLTDPKHMVSPLRSLVFKNTGL